MTGTTYFDHTLNNLAPVNLARVKDGKFEYWLAPRQHGHEGATFQPFNAAPGHALRENRPGGGAITTGLARCQP